VWNLLKFHPEDGEEEVLVDQKEKKAGEAALHLLKVVDERLQYLDPSARPSFWTSKGLV